MDNRETEESVIGAIALVGEQYDDVADILVAEDFHHQDTRAMWEALEYLADQGQPIDPVTIADRLKLVGVDLAAFGQICRRVVSAANVVAYAQRVRDRSIERQLASAGARIRAIAEEPGEVQAKIDRSQALVMGVADTTDKSNRGPVMVRTILPRVIDAVDERSNCGSAIVGRATGFDDIDAITAGLHKADLIIVAGRPSMGKTTFAMNIAEHQALEGNAVAVFSLEMSADQLVEREVASLARVDYQRFRVGSLDDDEWPRITEATKRLADSKLIIDDTPALAVYELRARARRLHRDHKLGLIIVDYIQLMSGEGKNGNERIGSISRGLKSLAKELDVPVIALSQLNRSLEQRPNKRPRMSDLRDSGEIEQDADLIVFIYRDEVYNPDGAYQGTAEAIIGKQRNGALGTVHLTFLGHMVRFESFAGEWPKPERGTRIRASGGFDYTSVEHLKNG